jgi:hypothetical protein
MRLCTARTRDGYRGWVQKEMNDVLSNGEVAKNALVATIKR